MEEENNQLKMLGIFVEDLAKSALIMLSLFFILSVSVSTL